MPTPRPASHPTFKNLKYAWLSICALTRSAAASRCVLRLALPLVLASLIVAGSEGTARANTYTATTCAELKSYILLATFGDIINVNTSVTCTEAGPIMLPYKGTGTDYITIQSSALANLPDYQRVGPTSAVHMPKIITQNHPNHLYGPPAISTCIINSNTSECPNTTAAPHHWKLIGLEITSVETSTVDDLVVLGNPSNTQNESWEEPADIIVDRCYIHSPTSTTPTRNGITISSRNTTIRNSYISGIKKTGEETHAIMIINSSGQVHIINNYLEAAGINFFISNQDTLGIVSDVEVRGNYLRKLLSWNQGDLANYENIPWVVKGLVELKQGIRVTFDGNILENCWGGPGGDGTAVAINPLPDSNQNRWVTDLIFSNNIVRHAAGGASLSGGDDPTIILDRAQFTNNLWEDINSSWANNSGVNGRAFTVISNADNVTIEHNTIINNGQADSNTVGNPPAGFIFRNNIVNGDAASGLSPGDPTLNSQYLSPAIWMNNIQVASTGVYVQTNHTGNLAVASYSNVGFVNLPGGDYHLASGSIGENAGTDGQDIGANITALNNATCGTISGTPCNRVNFALTANGGQASAPTWLEGREAIAAINGDRKGIHWGTDSATGSGWHDATPDIYTDDYLIIEFNGSKTIDEIDVFSVQDSFNSPVAPTEAMTFSLYGLAAFEVQYLVGSTWVAVPNASVTGNNLVWKRFTFPSLTTSKIKIIVSHGLASYSRITEVEAWGYEAASPRTNVALTTNGGLASAPTRLLGREELAAINGERKGIHWGTDSATGSGWHDATTTFPDTLEIVFNGSKTIDEIDIFSVQDNFNSPVEPTETMTFSLYGTISFDVQYWNGTSWVTVPGGNVTNNNLVWKKLTFPSVTTTKILITINASGAGYSRLTEVEAWGH